MGSWGFFELSSFLLHASEDLMKTLHSINLRVLEAMTNLQLTNL